jgi:hypothetical protein
MEIYEAETKMWRERSSEKWLLFGDNNSSYFHNIANGRKRKNTMYSLQNDGTLIQGTDSLLTHATYYYKSLFEAGESNRLSLDPLIWAEGERLSLEDNQSLDEPFSKQEVKFALDSMAQNKAPGPDGIPIEFYQACWPIIKHDIKLLFEDLYLGKLDLYRLNFGMIILLQKVKDVDTLSEYRPICLLQVIYKIITKVATIRVEPVMGKLISPAQTAFIKGRNIMDGVLSLHEMLHESRRKKQQGVVLKLDFEKACDKVDWNFLFKCTSQRGFSENGARFLILSSKMVLFLSRLMM